MFSPQINCSVYYNDYDYPSVVMIYPLIYIYDFGNAPIKCSHGVKVMLNIILFFRNNMLI